MFRKKSTWLMGGSLTMVSLLLMIWAMTSMLQAQVSSLRCREPAGACCNPCTDDGEVNLPECNDVGTDTCDPNHCMFNTFRVLQCTGNDTDPCPYHEDPNDWARWIELRLENCPDNVYGKTTVPSCGFIRVQGPLVGYAWTPCIAGSCETGEIVDAWADVNGRLLCGP